MATQTVTASTRYPSLAEIKSRTLKPIDAWWTVLVIDPIAIRVLWLLVRLLPGVTPNTITVVSVGVGFGAAGAFFTGHLVWGALIYQLSLLLDCIDGKLARLRGGGTQFGAVLDIVGNQAVNSLAFFCLIFGAGGKPVLMLGCGYLIVRIVKMELFQLLPGTMTNHSSQPDRPEPGWLERHRMQPPMMYVDRLMVLLTLGPLFGVVAEAFALVILVELAAPLGKLQHMVSHRRHEDGV